MRWFAALLLLLACAGASARELRLVEPSAGLAFSEAEVVRHAGSTRLRFLQDYFGRSGRLGCMAHCTVLGQVWEALLPVFRAQQPEREWPFTLVVVQDADVDALSFPDGTIVISEAFITRRQLAREQVAFVLAHEAAHVLLQHERQTLTTMLAVMPSNARRTPRDLYTEMEFRYFALSDPLSLMFHQVEFEADEAGQQMAALAGFAPDAQLRFLERAAQAADAPAAGSTHPAMADRLLRLRTLLPLARRLFETARE